MVDTRTVEAPPNPAGAIADIETLRRALAGGRIGPEELAKTVRRVRNRLAHLQGKSARFDRIGVSEHIDKLVS